jgi:membrane-associated phospholipid phosphatase
MEEVTAAPRRARFTRVELGILVLAVGFVVLAALVAGGRLDSLDRYSIVHWMPGHDPAKARHTVPPVSGVFLPFDLDPAPWWNRVLETFMYPASVLVSLTVFAIGAAVLWRRGAKVAAVVWGSLWFVANALEVTAKIGIEKPELYRTEDGVTYHLAVFDHSFPSGHAMRAVLVAGLVLYVWRRLGLVAAAWAALMPIVLVITSWHVPSDVAGGVLFGLVAVLGAYAVIETISARQT